MLEVKGIRSNIDRLRVFIHRLREKGIAIIFTKHVFDPINNSVEAKLFPGLLNARLRDNTLGAEIIKELKPFAHDVIIKKRRYDAFIGTELDVYLRGRKIETLIITGTMTNICCESTARTAMMRDYKVLFCSDLTFTSDPELHKNTLKNISSHFGKVMTSEELCKLLLSTPE